jgi:hypothetical protein
MAFRKPKPKPDDSISTSLEFYSALKWLDGRPLLDTMAAYRRRLHTSALDTFDENGLPRYNFVLAGRAKKNDKTTDIALAALYKLVVPKSVQGNDGYLIASDEDQAGDDLDLIKKLVAANPVLKSVLTVYKKEIKRKDGRGVLKVLPARDVAGLHGKQGNFLGFDEIHSYKNYDLFEALAPDPTRRDALTWVSSYQSIYSTPGIPIVDFYATGKAGTDPRMLFSWYSGDYCTDPDFAELPAEQRANPSMSKWVEGERYLEQQRQRLPTHKFRRLHLNLPGAPNNAFLDQGKVMEATDVGIKVRQLRDGVQYYAFVDMAGGSHDDAVLAIAHAEDNVAVLDLIAKQTGAAPFNPRNAVQKFCEIMRDWGGIYSVVGDNYAGTTFAHDFEERGIRYHKSHLTKTEIFERFEPKLNSGLVRLLDVPELIEQLLTLVVRGARIEGELGSNDDWPNAACGALGLVVQATAYSPIAVATSGGAFMLLSDEPDLTSKNWW